MKQTLRQQTTLKDIAKVTGYTANTVSRALRGKEDIADATRDEIKKVAAEMGYVNNALASSLRLGHTNTIAVILGDISNPHFSIMMKEIESRARTSGYSSFLINTNENAEMEREAILSALNKNVDGIIICPAQQTEDNIRYLMGTGLPFIQIGRHFDIPDASYVVCDDELGGYQATKHLLAEGHSDILMLLGPPYISSALERLAGYKRAFRDFGLRIKPELIREVPITSDGCEEVIAGILREKLHFTAIFGFSDMIAWDAWTCLTKQGYRIPFDYSLVGFDNIQSRLAIPFQLSTIKTRSAKMSTTAVKCLLSLMSGQQPAPCRLKLETELVEGETVRALRGAAL